jgi:hypothetical protein
MVEQIGSIRRPRLGGQEIAAIAGGTGRSRSTDYRVPGDGSIIVFPGHFEQSAGDWTS